MPILALIFSFMSFYTAKVTASFGGQTASQSGHESAWHGFFGWFAVLLALVAAALVALELFAPQVKLPIATRLAALAALALSVLFMIIALFVTPGTADNVPSGYKVDYGRGFGYWLTLILIVAAAVVTFLRFQQTGGKLSDFAGSKGGGSRRAARPATALLASRVPGVTAHRATRRPASRRATRRRRREGMPLRSSRAATRPPGRRRATRHRSRSRSHRRRRVTSPRRRLRATSRSRRRVATSHPRRRPATSRRHHPRRRRATSRHPRRPGRGRNGAPQVTVASSRRSRPASPESAVRRVCG